jgi:hypothetical protein
MTQMTDSLPEETIVVVETEPDGSMEVTAEYVDEEGDLHLVHAEVAADGTVTEAEQIEVREDGEVQLTQVATSEGPPTEGPGEVVGVWYQTQDGEVQSAVVSYQDEEGQVHQQVVEVQTWDADADGHAETAYADLDQDGVSAVVAQDRDHDGVSDATDTGGGFLETTAPQSPALDAELGRLSGEGERQVETFGGTDYITPAGGEGLSPELQDALNDPTLEHPVVVETQAEEEQVVETESDPDDPHVELTQHDDGSYGYADHLDGQVDFHDSSYEDPDSAWEPPPGESSSWSYDED